MSDVGIDLSFGPDTVKPDEYKALDEAIYPMYCSNVEVTMTKAGEQMIVCEWTVTGEVRPGAKIRNDNLIIPGAKRKAEDPDKWNQMMNMLRDKLEVITGRAWEEDNMRLNPYTDIGGAQIKAIVVQESYDAYTNAAGEEKPAGVGNKIQRYLRPDDNTTTYKPKTPAPSSPANSASPSPAPAAAQQSGGFSI